MSDKVQAALEARRKRLESTRSNDRVAAALEARKKRLESTKNDQTSVTSDLQKRYSSVVDSFNSATKNYSRSYGEKALSDTLDKYRADTIRVSDLRKDLELNRKNIGNDKAVDEMLSTLNSISDGYRSIFEDAKLGSQFKDEDEFQTAVRESKYFENHRNKDYSEILADIVSLPEGEEKEWLSAHQYDILRFNDDFSEYSDMGSSAVNPSWEEAATPFSLFGWKPMGEGADIGNIVTFAEQNKEKAVADAMAAANGGGYDSERTELVNLINVHMKDDEKAIYNYLIGKGEHDRANEYITQLSDVLRQRAAGRIVDQIEGSSMGMPLELMLSAVAGLENFGTGIKNLGAFVTGAEGAPTSVAQYAHSFASEDNSGVWKVVNDLAYTTGNMLPSILVSTFTSGAAGVAGASVKAASAIGGLGGSLTMGTSTSGNAYAEMRNLGYDENQARAYGTLVGASEAGLSYLFGGIGKLGGKLSGKAVSKLVSHFDNAIARAAISFGGNIISEGVEEAVQTVLEPAFKALVTGEEFDSPEWSEVFYSALLGALSAGVVEGVPTIAGEAVSNYRAKRDYGDIQSELVAEGLESAEGSLSNNLAQKYQKKLDSGKDLSGSQLKRLVEANEQQFAAEDLTAIQTAAENRLSSLGETGNVKAISAALAKQASGEKLTRAEKKLLKESKFGQRVSDELNPENIKSGKHTTAWTQNIGTNRINTKEYNSVETKEKVKYSSAASVGTVKDAIKLGDVAVSDKGEARVLSTGENVTIDKNDPIARIDTVDGENVVVYNTTAGEVASSDIEYDNEDTAVVYEALARFGTSNKAIDIKTLNQFISGFVPGKGLSSSEYVSAIEDAYRYGVLGYSVNELASDKAISLLPSEQRKAAYKLGKQVGVNDASARQKTLSEVKKTGNKKKGKLFFDGRVSGRNLTEVQRASLKALGTVSDSLGIDIHIFESETDESGRRTGANGWYDPKDNSIHIDLYSGVDGKGMMLFTAAHELTHLIRKNAPEKFKAFADFLFEEYNKSGKSVEELIQTKRAFLEAKGRITSDMTEKQAYDLAYEEVVADSCEAMLVDSNAIETISKLKAQDKGLWQTIKDFIDRLVRRIRAAYKGLNPDSAEANYVRDMVDVAEKLQKLWAEALAEAAETSNLVEIDTVTKSASPMLSERTWTASTNIGYGYNALREALAKDGLDELSVKLGNRFPLSASFDATMTADNTPLTMATVTKNSVARINGKSAYAAGKAAFKKAYGIKTKVHIKQMDIDAELYTDVAKESINKAENRQDEQTVLDVIPQLTDILSNSILASVERIAHVNNKGTVLYGYRLYNLYWYEETVEEVNSNGQTEKKNKKTPHCLVCTVVQNTEKAEGYVFRDIENVTINHGLPITNNGMPEPANNDTYTISQLYQFVKGVKREDGGLKYSPAEKSKYLFTYTKRNDGVLYQDRPEESMSNRAILANALESTANSEAERELLAKYKTQIDEYNAEEQKLHDLRRQIKDLSFAKGARDTKRLKELQLEANKSANRINIYDKRLLKLESAKNLKDVLEREKAMVRKRMEEKGRELKTKAVQKKTESIYRKREKDKLQKLILDTARWLKSPSKNEVKCPDFLRVPFAAFLESIDMSSKSLLNGGHATKNDYRIASTMDSLATAIDKIRKAQSPSEKTDSDGDNYFDSGYLDLPDNFVENIRLTAEGIKNMIEFSGNSGLDVMQEMTSEEMKELSKIIKVLKHSISEMQALYTNYRYANIMELGRAEVEYLSSLGETANQNGFKDFVKWDNGLPYYVFKRFGKAGESIFESLMDSQDKLAFLADEIFKFKEKSWSDKEVKAWSKDVHTIELSGGKKITLTSADAMGLYCLYQREISLNGYVDHLLKGGIKVVDKSVDKSKTDKVTETHLTKADIEKIISTLDKRQIEVADKIQEFMSTECATWGNEIFYKRFLTNMFTEKKYYPMESNPQGMDYKDPSAQQSDMFRLLNISATKPLTKGANNQIIIKNIFDVFAAHTSDMAKLNAYGMALLDYMKWVNYKEKTTDIKTGQITVKGVRKALDDAYGEAAFKYVTNLIKDVNGRGNIGDENAFVMKMLRMSKVAAVGSNLRVALLQPTALPRAMTVLKKSSILYGLKGIVHPKKSIEKAKKYCGIALWKSFGFYDTNISRNVEQQIKGGAKVSEKLVEASMKFAEWGDSLTWGCLWDACELEVAKSKKYTVGTKEFYQAVGKKLREVVYSSQVVDSVLTRSQLMRKKGGLTQRATSFMGEPTLSYNILLDAESQFRNEVRSTGSAKAAWKKTRGLIGKAVTAYMTTQILAAVVEALADAFRDDEEKPFGEKFLDATWQNLLSDLLIFNKIPFLNDITSLVLSKFGVGYFSSSDMSTDYLNTLSKAYDAWADIRKNGDDADKTLYYAIFNTTKFLSQVTRLPVSNAMREVVTVWNNTAGNADYRLKLRTYENSSSVNAENLYQAILSGDKDRASKLEKLWDTEGKRLTALRTALRENDPRIKLAAKARYEGNAAEALRLAKQIIAEGKFGDEIVYPAINTELGKLKPKSESDKGEVVKFTAEDYYKAIVYGDSISVSAVKDVLIQQHIAAGNTTSDAEKSIASGFVGQAKKAYINGTLTKSKAISLVNQYGGDTVDGSKKVKEWDFEIDTGYTWSGRDNAYRLEAVSEDRLISYIMDIEGKTKAEAGYEIKSIEFKTDYPEYSSISTSTLAKYYSKVKDKDYTLADKGIDVEEFADYCVKVNGKTRKVDKLKVIDKLPLSSSQKDALYYYNGWAKSELHEAPWH